MEKQIRERIYNAAKKTVEGGCSPMQLQQSFVNDYVEYMTESGLISESVLVSSIGFSHYTNIMIDFVEHFEFQPQFLKLIKDINSFKLSALCKFMDLEKAYDYYYTEIDPMPQEFIDLMKGFIKKTA
jgi:hypothetical protein